MGSNTTQDHVSELLSHYIDGHATPRDAGLVEAHVQQCDACRTELASLLALKRLLGQVPAFSPPRSFVLGPRPAARRWIAGSWAGAARAMTSVAAALAVLAIAGSLLLNGLPRTQPGAASAQVAPPSVSPLAPDAPQTGSPARAEARPAAAPAGAAGAAAAEAGRQAASPQAAAARAAAPAGASAAQPARVQEDRPAASQPRPPSPPAAAASPQASGLNVPRLAGELLVLAVCLGVVIYSLRWWRE